MEKDTYQIDSGQQIVFVGPGGGRTVQLTVVDLTFGTAVSVCLDPGAALDLHSALNYAADAVIRGNNDS